MQQYKDALFAETTKRRRLDDNGFAENFFLELNMLSLNSFYQRAQRDLLEFLAYFRINRRTEKIFFGKDDRYHENYLLEEFRLRCFFNGLHSKDVLAYWSELLRRKTDIEKVIDGHFEMIKDSILKYRLSLRDREIEQSFAKEVYRQRIDQAISEVQFNKDPDLRFDDNEHYTYARKLEKLITFEQDLLESDINSEDNLRRTQRICRLQG